jgi:hypothetical protein
MPLNRLKYLLNDDESILSKVLLLLVQGITSLTINEEGNPIYRKAWRQYAIYRLEHWGLLYINNRSRKIK